MGKSIVVNFLALFLLVFCGLPRARSQEQNKPPENPTAEHPKAAHAYRVEFLINELDDGKKANTRHYSINLNSGERSEIKIGTRVPVVTGAQNQWQYLDVGTTIHCGLVEFGDDVSLRVDSEFSNLSSPEEQHSSQPIIRRINISGSTLAGLGKPVVIGSADDPTSNRQFQLEASVTRLK